MSQTLRNWRESVIQKEGLIGDVVRNLNASGLRICLVLDDDKKLLGTISDGDIRRGLLEGKTLASPCLEITRKNPLVVPRGVLPKMVRQMMVANKVQQIPEVDELNRVVDLHTWEEFEQPKSQSAMVVIMAGGQGVRLRPLTADCPKPMLKVSEKPMLEHIIEHARDQGFQRFVIAINYLGHMIENHFAQGERLGVKIEYVKENKPMGTAGALSLLSPDLGEPFIVTNGDVMTDIQYRELLDFHYRQGADLTMAVRLHEWQHPFGVVEMNGLEIAGFEEKPTVRTHINAGIYALSPIALSFVERDQPCDMPTLFERAKAKGLKVVAYPMHEPWLDVGRPSDLEIANQ
jgi:dTDP-glucose pyrophosphorylase